MHIKASDTSKCKEHLECSKAITAKITADEINQDVRFIFMNSFYIVKYLPFIFAPLTLD
jgi:hypothetical protein